MDKQEGPLYTCTYIHACMHTLTLRYVSVPCFLPVVEAVVSLELRDANLDRVVFFMFRHVLDKKETEEGFQMVFKVLDMVRRVPVFRVLNRFQQSTEASKGL